MYPITKRKKEKRRKKKKRSFFPRNVRDWNNMGDSTVIAELIKEFKDILTTPDH